MNDDDENAYAFGNEDKRIVFMAIGTTCTIIAFFTVLAAIEDQSWEPVIIVLKIGGLVVATIVFFYYVVRGLWTAAKFLFPDNDNDE